MQFLNQIHGHTFVYLPVSNLSRSMVLGNLQSMIDSAVLLKPFDISLFCMIFNIM
jgi:hypothetical protein